MNLSSEKKRKYDAIVIGSGISGGWAAKELCEKGLKTLVLERGPKLDHITDYPTANKAPWELPNRNMHTQQDSVDYAVQEKCYAFNDGTRHLWVKDTEHPYQQKKPYWWIRGYHVGGKSLMWARQSYRMADYEFEENAQDGNGNDWPIRYKDLAPWYSYVEKFVGINGNRDGLRALPDGEFQPPMPLTPVEKMLQKSIGENYKDRFMVNGRSANLTKAINGRGQCQYRNLCHRGCPFGAAFSSNSATLPFAAETGKMTLMPDSIAHSIIYDDKKGKATGVRVINALTKEITDYHAKIIFVNAATLNTNLILMNSTSTRFPNGLGNDSGVLGHYLMDHHYQVQVSASYDGFADTYVKGRRPNGFYIPRFRNFGGDKQKDFLRGYAFGGNTDREGWSRGNDMDGFGADFKTMLTKPGKWNVFLQSQGEQLPHIDNKVMLNKNIKDQWGMPTLDIDCEWKPNEYAMMSDMKSCSEEMLEKAGFKNINAGVYNEPPGRGIHEMGGARMGKSNKDSVLNANNQVWGAPNVFVTDGASMASQGCNNPSLTFMALTARACDYAVKALNRREI
jgi:choline dehydrogenase-like flavoprotein